MGNLSLLRSSPIVLLPHHAFVVASQIVLDGTVTMSTSDAFSTLLSFYEKANLCLRIAIFIALTWPLSALVVAMFVRPFPTVPTYPATSSIRPNSKSVVRRAGTPRPEKSAQ